MASITRCFINHPFSRWLRLCLAALVLACALPAFAQNAAEISQLKLERVDDDILISAQLQFELPAAVEDALLKGIPLYFSVEADVMRERWYWYDKKITSVQRHFRLAYQPLTRRWRLNISSGSNTGGGVGLALNQSWDTLRQAMDVIKRISGWKIADATELDWSVKNKVDFRFRLDLSQLPRPFQIGALGQSDWDIAASSTVPLVVESGK